MNTQTDNSENNAVLRYFLLTVLIVFAFLLFIINKSKKKEELQPEVTTILSPTPAVAIRGSLFIKAAPENASPSLGEVGKASDYDVVASSDQVSIVGYDAVLKFEEGAFEIVSATSLLADFTVFPIEKSDHYIVTGVKKPESSEPSILNETPIVRLSLRPKKAGQLVLSVVEALGLEKSQMVDEETQILIPEVGEIKLKVK